MKIRVNEAESDYIKIGNMVLPKNAANMGYADYSTVARKAKKDYEAEKEAERKEKEKAEYREKGKKYYDKFIEIYNANANNSVDDLMSALFHEFVPSSGSCETLGAEFIRAIERIRYRSYNDGDRFYEGYGLETAAPDAAFIADYAPELESDIEDIVENNSVSDTNYNSALNDLAKSIVFYLKNNPELFGKPAIDSRYYDSWRIDDWKEKSHNLEYEPYLEDNRLYNLMDRDHVDWTDVYGFLEDVASQYGGEVKQWARDAFSIINLDREEYDEWERRYYDEFDYWLDELINEYGEYDEDDEDYDDED